MAGGESLASGVDINWHVIGEGLADYYTGAPQTATATVDTRLEEARRRAHNDVSWDEEESVVFMGQTPRTEEKFNADVERLAAYYYEEAQNA